MADPVGSIDDPYLKDPESVLDWVFDWTSDSWLETSETISSHTVTVPTGITLDSSSESGGKVTAWLSGGTAGITYRIECKITTSMSRTDERSRWVHVLER